MSESAGYVHGYNRRAAPLAVLIVQSSHEALSPTVARYLDRCSFVMAAVPERAASALQMFAFDGVVVPPAIDAATRSALARLAGMRVIEHDDPVLVARELRTVAVARRPRASAIALRA